MLAYPALIYLYRHYSPITAVNFYYAILKFFYGVPNF